MVTAPTGECPTGEAMNGDTKMHDVMARHKVGDKMSGGGSRGDSIETNALAGGNLPNPNTEKNGVVVAILRKNDINENYELVLPMP